MLRGGSGGGGVGNDFFHPISGRSAHCISTNTRATERERTTVFRKMPFPCLLATLALYVEDGGGGVVRPPIVVKVKPIAL